MASILASAASMPFVLYHFGVTTAWSVLANIIGMPLMAFIVMPAGVLALLLMPLGLEALALIPMEFGLHLLIGLADMIEGLPLSITRAAIGRGAAAVGHGGAGAVHVDEMVAAGFTNAGDGCDPHLADDSDTARRDHRPAWKDACPCH